MPPTIIFIRHAEALHNFTRDFTILDPVLTPLGEEQCTHLHVYFHGGPVTLEDGTVVKVSERVQKLVNEAGLIVTSPLRRTCQTAMGSLTWLIDGNVPVIADARLQETSAKPCDTGSSLGVVAPLFPKINFDSVDPVFPAKTGKYVYTQSAIEGRAYSILSDLYKRPEKVIIVVSHAGFLRVGLCHRNFGNADYRVFDFESPPSSEVPLPQDGDRVTEGLRGKTDEGEEWVLNEWQETREELDRWYIDRQGQRTDAALSGGLRKSWAGYAATDEEVDFL